MSVQHTDACIDARAGYTFKIFDSKGRIVGDTGAPDEYPFLYMLTEAGRDAVFACPHRDHDIVRTFVGMLPL